MGARSSWVTVSSAMDQAPWAWVVVRSAGCFDRLAGRLQRGRRCDGCRHPAGAVIQVQVIVQAQVVDHGHRPAVVGTAKAHAQGVVHRGGRC